MGDKQLKVREETHHRMNTEFMDEWLKHHPEDKGQKIPMDKRINVLLNYFLYDDTRGNI